MKQSMRMIAGLTAGLILISAGLAAGFAFKKQAGTKTVQEIASPQEKPEAPLEEKAPAINNNTYTVSAPSQGRAYMSVPFLFENMFGLQAMLVLSPERAKDVMPDQAVILYDGNGKPLDAIGVVTSVDNGKGHNDENRVIRISLNPLPDGASPAPVHGEIITMEVPQSYRLPLTALKGNEEEGFYIWEAISKENKTTVKKRPITGVKKANNTYFIMNRPAYISDIYILDPDDALRDNQEIKTTASLYSPGIIPNAAQIAAIPRLPPPREDNTPEISIACGEQPACGSAAGEAAAFIQRIKSLAAEMPKQSKPAPSPAQP